MRLFVGPALAGLFLLAATSPAFAGGQPPIPQPPPAPTVGYPPAGAVGGGQLKWWRAVWRTESGVRVQRLSLHGYVITKAHPPVAGWRMTCEAWKAQPRQTCENFPVFGRIHPDWPASIQQWASLLVKVEGQTGVDRNILAAIMEQESRGNQYAVGVAVYTPYGYQNAVGLMQVLPYVAYSVDVGLPATAALADSYWNIWSGARLLAYYWRYWGDIWTAVASYYAGFILANGWSYEACVRARFNGFHGLCS